jgi:RhtB (resistance to homoserine/threonine) family protein
MPVYLQVAIVALLAGMSPGPDFFLVMRNSLGYGRRVGIATALGIAGALAVHASYSIIGLALIIRHQRWLFAAIQVSGALYLAYLGISAIVATFRRKKEDGGAEKPPAEAGKSFLQGFANGFLCNILNPKAFVFFLSVFSQFLARDSSKFVELVYGIEVVAVGGAWFILVATAASLASFQAFYLKAEKWLDRFFGAVLLVFAARIFLSVLVR